MVMTLLTRPKKTVATFVIATDGSGDFNCDGTVDDVEIQAAIDTLPATGGCIYMKEGTYTITTPIEINKIGISITGCGYSTLLQTALNINIFNLSANNFHLEKMRLNGSGTGNYSIYSVSTDYIGGGVIMDLWIADFTEALHLEYIDAIVISHCFIDTISNDAISIGYGNETFGASEILLDGCRFAAIDRYGIYLNGACSYNKISNNTFVGACLQWAIYLNDNCDRNIITSNNVMFMEDTGGIRIEDNCDFNVVCANTITDIIGGDGVVITEDCESNLVSSNVFRGCGIPFTSGGGVLIDDNSDFNSVVANIFEYNEEYNVRIANANCEHNCISGNHSHPLRPAGIGTARIEDLGTSSNIFNNSEWT